MSTTSGTIKHRHQTTIAAGSSDVDAPQWNDSEVVASAAADGQVMVKDSTQTDGWGLVPLVTADLFANRPAAGQKGKLWLPTDGFTLAEDNGASWLPSGPAFPFTTPSDSGYSWVNQGTDTLTVGKDSLQLVGGAQGNVQAIVGRVKTAPATPYTLTMYARAILPSVNYMGYGLWFRDSGTTNFHACGFFFDNGLWTPGWSWNSSKGTGVGFTAHYQRVEALQQPMFMRIGDDGVNRKFSVSDDGQNWITVHTVARTDFLTANQIGYWVSDQNAATPNFAPVVTILSLG